MPRQGVRRPTLVRVLQEPVRLDRRVRCAVQYGARARQAPDGVNEFLDLLLLGASVGQNYLLDSAPLMRHTSPVG